MPLQKQTVKCPDHECKGKDIVIFSGEEGKGLCPECGCDVESVYRVAHYNQLAKNVSVKEEPEPKPKPPNKKKTDPFSFSM
jgi:hypothetical protein